VARGWRAARGRGGARGHALDPLAPAHAARSRSLTSAVPVAPTPQEALLCAAYATSRTLTRERKEALSAAAHLTPRTVELFFHNARARGAASHAAARLSALEAEVASLRKENAQLRHAAGACAAAMDAMQHAALAAVTAARRDTAAARAVLQTQAQLEAALRGIATGGRQAATT
jgi:hypothetical protein